MLIQQLSTQWVEFTLFELKIIQNLFLECTITSNLELQLNLYSCIQKSCNYKQPSTKFEQMWMVFLFILKHFGEKPVVYTQIMFKYVKCLYQQEFVALHPRYTHVSFLPLLQQCSDHS